MKKDKLLDMLMNCVIICLMVGSLSAAFLRAIYIPISSVKIIYIIVVSFLILTVVFWNKWTTLILLPLTLVIMTGLFFLIKPQKLLESASTFVNWLVNYISGIVYLETKYISDVVWLCTSSVTFIYFIVMIKLRNFIIPFLLGTVLLFTLWFLGHTSIVWYIWFFAIGCIMAWGGNYHRKLSKQFVMPKIGLWQASALPLAIAIILTARIIIPSNKKDLRWPYLVQKVDMIEEKINDRFGFSAPRQNFRLSETGFPSSQDELGGPVIISGDLVMKVSSPIPLHLRGTLLNEYTGIGWKDTIDDKRYRFNDKTWNVIRESAYSFDENIWNDLTDDKLLEFFLPVEAQITHVGIKSSVLFNAQMLKEIKPTKGASWAYFNAKGETFTSRNIRVNETYTINARVPNINNSEFIDYIKSISLSVMFSQEELIEKVIKELPTMVFQSGEKAELSPNQENAEVSPARKLSPTLVPYDVLENYMALPDSVTQRLYDLVYSLTVSEHTSIEKLIAIQKYLEDNYEYTLNPPYTPADRDFVDYFLFDLKEGYCTYFATAMAVMGRAAGIPTRYVEGFLMPPFRNTDGLYEVKKLNGHAWIEAYIPKVGWVPFDPTPASDVLESITQSIGGSGGTPVNSWDYYMQQLLEQQRQQQGNIPDFSNITPGNTVTTTEVLESIGITSLITFISLLLILALVLAFIYIRYIMQISKQSFKQQLNYYYTEILWLLKLYGTPINQGETPYAYAERVDQWLVNPAGTMEAICKVIVESEFGYYELKEPDIELMKAFYRHSRSTVIKVLGYHRYIIKMVLRLINHKHQLKLKLSHAQSNTAQVGSKLDIKK